MTETTGREALAEVLAERMARGTSGRWIADFGVTPDRLARAALAHIAAVLADPATVEVVARANYEALRYMDGWESLRETSREVWRIAARAALRALAAHLGAPTPQRGGVMSEQVQLTEAERLAEQLDRWERGLDGANETDAWQNRLARAILASDWLAAREKPLRDSLARVEALRDKWLAERDAPFGEAHMSYAYAQHELSRALASTPAAEDADGGEGR